MNWAEQMISGPAEKHHGIRCMDCKTDLPSKSFLRSHMGHDVRYLDKEGKPLD